MGNREMVDDMNVRPEFLGLSTLMVPFAQHTSSQRIIMFCSNIEQALVVDGCEQARICTGFEKKIGEYEFSMSELNQDVQVHAIIPKFQPRIGTNPIREYPELTAIYVGSEDNKIDYMTIKKHQGFSGGFGWENKWMNQGLLKPDGFIPAGTKFMTSPNHDGNQYKQGMNANFVTMSLPDVAEDAFVISESLAKKGTNTVVQSMEIMIDQDDIPLNLYGDDDDYKILPNIRETVRDDGILIAFRNVFEKQQDATQTIRPIKMADTTDLALREPNVHDDVYIAEPGAEVIDIQVYTNPTEYKKQLRKETRFRQLIEYQEQHMEYYKKVISVYEKLKQLGFKSSPKFNNLVTRCLFFTDLHNRSIKLRNKHEQIKFMYLKVTYTHKRYVDVGSKITDRYGGKGVVSAIWPDDHMPTDDTGRRADLIISPETICNPMNPGQLYEQFFTRGADLVSERVRNNELGGLDQQHQHIIDYVSNIRPKYAELLLQQFPNKQDLVDAVREEGLYLIIAPYVNTDFANLIPEISENFGIKATPVTYVRKGRNGELKRIRTKSSILIGSKYIYLLGKIPLSADLMSSVEFGYVSQFCTPNKSKKKSIKAASQVSKTPVRLGEDETCITAMSIGAEAMSRYMGLYANSPDAVNELQRELLTLDKPTQLDHVNMTTEEIQKTNVNISLLRHFLASIGISYPDKKEKEKVHGK